MKSELLSKPINQEEIKNIQDRINENSKLINEMSNKLVNEYCKNLNEYVSFIKSILEDKDHPPTAQELDDFCMQLPTILFFCSEMLENLGIKSDVSKAIKQEKYNSIYRELTKGTINDKMSQSELAAQTEEIVRIVYDRAYKICKSKMEYATELLGSIKKVITRRISEMDLTKISYNKLNEKF